MDVFFSGSKVFVDKNKMISNGFTRTGDVYLLNNEEVIKIFRYVHPEDNIYYKNKLDILCKLKTKNFVIPSQIAFDEIGNIIGYKMQYIKGENGDAILNYSSKFLIEELEKIHDELSILSQNNVVIDDLISDNIIINQKGIYFIDVDDYLIRTHLNYDKNMIDSNFFINRLFKDIFAKNFHYKKNEQVNNMFDDYDIFYKEALKYYKPNQTVKSLVKRML